MDDVELVRRAEGGDQGAWAEIYDAYADRLHDYCHSIVRDRHDAADVLHDAFVTAATKVGQLRNPSRLRPWLYAICRTQALAVIRRRTREAPADTVAEMTAPALDHDEHADAELRELVAQAAGGLEARDRAVLFLHLRNGFEGKELGQALGVSAHHATVLLGRVRGNVERSLAALLVGRTGRGECAELDALLGAWDGSLSPLIRKRVARHIDGCEVCGERRRRMVSPLELLGSMPLVPAPTQLREPTLDDVALVAAVRPIGGRRAPSGKALAVAAGVAGLLLAGGLVVGQQTATVVPGEAVGPAAAPTSTTTGAAGTTSSAPAASKPAAGGAPASPASEPTVAPPSEPTGTTATADPAPDGPPAEPEPLVVRGLDTDRDFLGPDSACSTAKASATVTGDGPDTVGLTWQQAGGRLHRHDMNRTTGDTYTATIGPVAGTGNVTWHVTATDAAGNRTISPAQTVPVRGACG
ncbi:MAG: sigma-70 family RNA polymerase sigma factor [Thermocrispum sp.]